MNRRPVVMLASCVLKNVDAEVYGSHLSFAYRCGRQCLDYDFYLAAPQRLAIDYARNMAVAFAVANNFDFLFFYDDDTELDPDGMSKMLKVMQDHPEVTVLSSFYYVRGYPFEIMAFIQDPEKDKVWRFLKEDEVEKYTDPQTKLIGPLVAVGNGCTLYRVELFKMVDQNLNLEVDKKVWFKTTYGIQTEDVYFFIKAREQVDGIGIYMMSDSICGHELARKNIVDKNNVQLLRKQAEEFKQDEGLFVGSDQTPKHVKEARNHAKEGSA